jgi:hypothetical protein
LFPPAPFPLSTPPPAPVLVSALYNESEAQLELAFDRSIDISAIDPSQITVKDGVQNSSSYVGINAAQSGDQIVIIVLDPTGPYAVPEIKMSATSLNGIVALFGGGAWPGVSNLPLPFP